MSFISNLVNKAVQTASAAPQPVKKPQPAPAAAAPAPSQDRVTLGENRHANPGIYDRKAMLAAFATRPAAQAAVAQPTVRPETVEKPADTGLTPGAPAPAAAPADPTMPKDAEQQKLITGTPGPEYKAEAGLNGVTIYRGPDGHTIAQGKSDINGVSATETTINGTTHKYSEQTSPDGTTKRLHSVTENGKTVLVADTIHADGRTERDTTTTSKSDKGIEELAGAPADSKGKQSLEQFPKNAGNPSEIEHTESELFVPGQPVKRVATMDTVTQKADVQEANLPDGTKFDKSKSGITRSTTVIEKFDDNGKGTVERSDGMKVSVVGSRDGQPVSVERNTLVGPDGTANTTTEHKGFRRSELAGEPVTHVKTKDGSLLVPVSRDSNDTGKTALMQVGVTGGFNEWNNQGKGDDPIVGVSTTLTETSDGKKSYSASVGDLSGDGRLITRQDSPQGVLWTQQETSQNGKRVATQTTSEGHPELRIQTLKELGEHGSARQTTQVFRGDAPVQTTTLNHEAVTSVDRLNELEKSINEGDHSSPEHRQSKKEAFDKLRARVAAGEPVYLDQLDDKMEGGAGELQRRHSQSTSVSDPESGIKVGRVGEYTGLKEAKKLPGNQGSQGVAYKDSEVVIDPSADRKVSGYVDIARSGEDKPGGMIRIGDADHHQAFSLDQNGEHLSTPTGLDGGRHTPLIQALEDIDATGRPAADAEKTGNLLADQITPVTNTVTSAGDAAGVIKFSQNLASKLGNGGLGALGSLVGGFNVYQGIANQDANQALSGFNNFGGGAVGLGASLPGDTLTVLGKRLGIAGGVAGAVVGLREIGDGKVVKGGLDLGSGVLLTAAAYTGNPWLLAGAAVLTVGGIAYEQAGKDDTADINQTKEINGQKLFVN